MDASVAGVRLLNSSVRTTSGSHLQRFRKFLLSESDQLSLLSFFSTLTHELLDRERYGDLGRAQWSIAE